MLHTKRGHAGNVSFLRARSTLMIVLEHSQGTGGRMDAVLRS